MGLVVLALSFASGLVHPAGTFAHNWVLTGYGIGLVAAGVCCVIMGTSAILRHHERSRAVAIATALGFLVAATLLHEVGQGLTR